MGWRKGFLWLVQLWRKLAQLLAVDRIKPSNAIAPLIAPLAPKPLAPMRHTLRGGDAVVH